MDLKKRLASLDRLSRKQGASAGGGATGDAAATLSSLGLTEDGNGLWVREYRDAIPPPSDLPDLGGFFTRLAPGPVTPEDLLFLDTETTGLVGGTGTIPFLVGVSWWSGSTFVTRQYFLSGPGREGPLLDTLAELARRFKSVVTFNGASFDLPLLRTRARLERRPDPVEEMTSWDLLVPARRIWGNTLPDCRQQTLEVSVCGQERLSGDIDGSRIPQVWFDFLATGLPGSLPAVLTHNHRDMKGMARLFLKVVEAAGGSRSPDDRVTPWREAWALGRICERRRENRTAGLWLAKALEEAKGAVAPVDPRLIRDGIRILKRGGDWAVVEGVITSGLASGINEPWLHREAAILYEHRVVSLQRALEHARQAGEEGRVGRLERRLALLKKTPQASGRKART